MADIYTSSNDAHYTTSNDATYTSSSDAAPRAKGTFDQVMNGTHPVIQDTKADFKGLATSGTATTEYDDDMQPVSHFHNLFYDLFTWKFPKATGFFFFSTISTIFAFHYVNVLRYVFKGAYMLFAAAAVAEMAGKPFGAQGLASSMRPRRYWTIPRESLERFFDQLHELINFFVLEFQRVVFVENIFTTIAAFFTTFIGYFLIKYMPLWALSLLTTVIAFTAPLIYINNQEVIDESIRRISEKVNAQFETTKKLTGKYAEDAAARAKALAFDAQHKVQDLSGAAKARAQSLSGAAKAKAQNVSGTAQSKSQDITGDNHTSPVDTEYRDAPSAGTAREFLSDDANGREYDYPQAPTSDPSYIDPAKEPLLA